LCRDTVSFRFPLTLFGCSRPLGGVQIDDFCAVLRERISFDGLSSNEIFTV
jgi:hypothetical protein